MQDSELLKLAAKAAGISMPAFIGYCGGEYARAWDPLEDDGDALQLAVVVRLEIFIHENDTRVTDANMIAQQSISHGDDACAATRRAIVRAAAEIGKAMP